MQKRLLRVREIPRLANWLLLAGCGALALLLVMDSPLAMQGAREGLALSGQVIIPSMYPFFVIGGLFVQLIGNNKRRKSALLWKLLRQPPAAMGVILLGLLGGYPLGAKTATQLMERGQLTRGQAQRLQLFCVNAGPAYLIGAVGSALLGNRRAGLILFISMAAASLIIGLCTRFLAVENEAVPADLSPEQTHPIGFDQRLLSSVTQATKSILSVCAWVVLFSALCALLHRLPMSAWGAIPVLNVFLEVSSGAAAVIRANVALPVLCAALCWGGLSVHCQVLGDIKKTGLPLRLFWTSRLLHGGLAAAFCLRLLQWFPVSMPTAVIAGSRVGVRMWAVSAPAAAALLVFCAFVILELDLNRKIC